MYKVKITKTPKPPSLKMRSIKVPKMAMPKAKLKPKLIPTPHFKKLGYTR